MNGCLSCCNGMDFLFSFLLGRKKAYMSIDANHVSNPKDR